MMNVDKTCDAVLDWIRSQVAATGAEGCVLNVSGGIDSATTAALCARAVPGRVLGLILPCGSAPEDERLARTVGEAFDIELQKVDLAPPYEALVTQLRAREGEAVDRVVLGNIKARLRMTTLYAFANARDYLAVGTSNRSELYLGYYTKYGDGGSDVIPMGNLTKGQVRALAQHLDVPRVIVERKPSAGLWEGQADEDELGLTYEQIDAFLLRGRGDGDAVEQIRSLHRASEHKRQMPPAGPEPV